MNQLIVLTFNHENENNYILNKMNETPGLNVYPVLHDQKFIGKCLRRINFKFFPFYIDLWFSRKWIRTITPSDTVVCIANKWSPIILKRISKVYHCKCINYFWDKISVAHYPIVKSHSFENWTFDFEDSQKYHMHYNPQFYVENLIGNQPIEYDISFVGADRNGTLPNRVTMANSYYSKMQSLNLKLYFYLLTNSSVANPEFAYHTPLDVKTVLDLMMRSKAILEIIEPGEAEWLTLRPFQALSNHRKLITNSTKIANYDFYNPNNIFIIGQDSWDNLPHFLNTPFEQMDCLENYSISNWKARFLQMTGI